MEIDLPHVMDINGFMNEITTVRERIGAICKVMSFKVTSKYVVLSNKLKEGVECVKKHIRVVG